MGFLQMLPLEGANVRLCLVDVPGLNDSETAEMYKNYVGDHFGELDFVVVVLDVNQGVNTEDTVGLLRFVREKNTRQVPVCVLVNKIDHAHDLENPEIKEVLRQIQVEVDRVWQGTVQRPEIVRVS